MLKTIFIALITYVATSIDEIPVLFMLYTKKSNKGKEKTITSAYFIGTFILIAISLLGAFGIGLIPEKWIIGLGADDLGVFIPLFATLSGLQFIYYSLTPVFLMKQS